MDSKSRWSTEVDRLLGGFALLPGLLVRESRGADAQLEARLVSLAPTHVGLSCQVVGSEDWELFRGGILYAADCLEQAHALFQEVQSPEGAYWHGMLHRREGDFSNALYWVRRAGRIPGVRAIADFSPTAFIEECAAAAALGVESPHLLEAQRREWEALIQWSWRRLAGSGGYPACGD